MATGSAHGLGMAASSREHGTAGSARDRGTPRALRAVASATRQLWETVGEAGDNEPASWVEAMRALEDLKDAACAAQAELAVQLVDAEVDLARARAARSVDPDASASTRRGAIERATRRARRSAVGQVALARRESPHRGGILVGMAEALVREMPRTFAALGSGRLNEYRAMLLVRETACLDREGRAEVDALVCGDPASLEGVGTRRLVALAREHAYRLDPASFVHQAERNATERNVTLRPAPGSMTYLTALLPLAQGVATLAALRTHAQSATARGDQRGTGQIMADSLVERVTGQSTADAVPVAVTLTMSDETLLGAGHAPAAVDGGYRMPAQLARELVARAIEIDGAGERARFAGGSEPPDLGGGAGVDPPGASSTPRTGSAAPSDDGARLGAWVRRLFTDPAGNVVAMDSRARNFPRSLAALLRIRDQGLCRMPWCDAPVAHLDHVTPVEHGGQTTAENGQGLCAGCNYTKQAPGWQQTTAPGTDPERSPGDPSADTATSPGKPPADTTTSPVRGPSSSPTRSTGRHTVRTTTPAGLRATSTAPPLPAPRRADPPPTGRATDLPADRATDLPAAGKIQLAEPPTMRAHDLGDRDPVQLAESAIEAAFDAIIELSYPPHVQSRS